MIQDLEVVNIPDKLYFRIGEVSKLLDVEPHVLRFWETEFSGLAPKKSEAGHRLFRRRDVELLVRIKDLLYKQKFTIEGARRTLDARGSATSNSAQRTLFPSDPLPQIREELEALLDLLSH